MKFKNLSVNSILFLALVFSIALVACESGKAVEQTQATLAPLSGDEYILKGAYLVKVGGCNDCHTPKLFSQKGMALDTSRLLSGHPAGEPLPPIDPRALQPGYWVLFNAHSTAAVGPWGLTYARNLTPHETGIKGWQEEFFIKSFRNGKHMGIEAGRPIMPPMPWFNLAEAPDEDLKAIFHYLKSIKPVNNLVPEPISPEEVLKMAMLEGEKKS